MAKKPGISFERHNELASELHKIRQSLLKIELELGNAFPHTGPASKPHGFMLQARTGIKKAETSLENLMLKDYPDKAQLGIYKI